MEYLPGLNLEQLVQREGPLPAGRVVHLVRQMVGALGEAHRRGLIHRDVKPGNVLVCRRGGVPDVVKLLDFGLVKHTTAEPGGDLTMAGGIAGTPAFMSPEQSMGRADLDARSDLYSVGAVAYYLLSGRHVFVKDTLYQVLAAHQYEKPTPLLEVKPGVPADLAAVVMRCLEKAPEARPQNAEALDQALGSCGCAGEWTTEQANAWWDAAGLDEEAVAVSEVASTLVK
jgi:serine/threonine-protein kinase